MIFLISLINTVSKNYLIKIIEYKINDISIYRKYYNQFGYAFIEFDSHFTAKKIIQYYNNKLIYGQLVQLNWAKSNPKFQKYSESNKKNIYTVSNINIIFLILIIALCRKS